MSSTRLMGMVGEIPPPFPVDYKAPMPADVANRPDVASLLNITARFDGDAAYAEQLFDELRFPLIAAESEVVLNAFERAELRDIGVSQADQAHMYTQALLNEVNRDKFGGFNMFGPLVMTDYFLSLDNLFHGSGTLLEELASRRLTLTREITRYKKRVGANPAILIIADSRELADIDGLLSDSDLGMDEAAELTSAVSDSLFNLLAKATLANSASFAMKTEEQLRPDSQLDFHRLIGREFRRGVQDILTRSISPSKKLVLVRQLFPVVFNLTRQLARDVSVADYMEPAEFDRLNRWEAQFGNYMLNYTVYSAERNGDSANAGTGQPVTVEEVVDQPVEQLATVPEVRRVYQNAMNLVAEWVPTTNMVKGYIGFTDLSKYLVTGASRAQGMNGGPGFTKPQARQVIDALVVLNEFTAAGYNASEIESCIDYFRAQLAGYNEEFESGRAELQSQGVSTLNMLNISSQFLNGLDIIRTNRAVISRAVRSSRFGNFDSLSQSLEQLFAASEQATA